MHAEHAVEPGEVTRLLDAAREGDRTAMERVIPLVYEDLRSLAARRAEGDEGALALSPTDVVQEAYVKHSSGMPADATDRAQFMAVAAHAMRRILVDHARQRRSARRNSGGWRRTTLSDRSWVADFEPDELLALNEALETLETRQRTIVECRFFAGMDEREIARALGLSERTVRRDWVKARAWLYHRLYGAPPC